MAGLKSLRGLCVAGRYCDGGASNRVDLFRAWCVMETMLVVYYRRTIAYL